MNKLNKNELKSISGGSELWPLVFLMIFMNWFKDGESNHDGREQNGGKGRRNRHRKNGNRGRIVNIIDIYNKNINKIEPIEIFLK